MWVARRLKDMFAENAPKSRSTFRTTGVGMRATPTARPVTRAGRRSAEEVAGLQTPSAWTANMKALTNPHEHAHDTEKH